MSKVEMSCVKCGFRVRWHEASWSEVMDYRINKNEYICPDCVEGLADRAVQKYLCERKEGETKREGSE